MRFAKKLPIGTALTKVEEFLRQRKMEFSYEAPSKSLHAIARKLKGSTDLVTKSLQFHLHFDEKLQLKSIDAKVLYTGP